MFVVISIIFLFHKLGFIEERDTNLSEILRQKYAEKILQKREKSIQENEELIQSHKIIKQNILPFPSSQARQPSVTELATQPSIPDVARQPSIPDVATQPTRPNLTAQLSIQHQAMQPSLPEDVRRTRASGRRRRPDMLELNMQQYVQEQASISRERKQHGLLFRSMLPECVYSPSLPMLEMTSSKDDENFNLSLRVSEKEMIRITDKTKPLTKLDVADHGKHNK